MAVTLSNGDPRLKNQAEKKKKEARPPEDIFAEFREGAANPNESIGERLEREQDERAIKKAMEEAKNITPAQKIINSICLFPALFSLLALFILAFFGGGFLEDRGLEWVMTALFGTTFFFFGLTILVSAKQPFGLLFMAIGGAVAGFTFVYAFGDEATQEFMFSRIIPVTLLALFPLAGTGIAVGSMAASAKRKKTYTLEVQARIIDKQKVRTYHRDSDGHRHSHWTYPLSWSYHYNDREYQWRNNSSRSPERREIGETGILLLNPDDPHDAIDPELTKFSGVFLAVFGIVFVAAGIIGLAAFMGIILA